MGSHLNLEVVMQNKPNSKLMDEKTRQAIAFHEAGHAIIASITRLRLKKISIFPDEDTCDGFLSSPSLCEGFLSSQSLCAASIRKHRGREVTARRRGEKIIMLALAGPAAQLRHAPRSKISGPGRRFIELDYDFARRAVRRINISEKAAEAHAMCLNAHVEHLVTIWWPFIGETAAKLLEQKTIKIDWGDALPADTLTSEFSK